jgi:hypothetical protein
MDLVLILWLFAVPVINSYTAPLSSLPTKRFCYTLASKRYHVILKNTSSDNKDDSIKPIQQPPSVINNSSISTSEIGIQNEKNRDNGLWTALRLGPTLLFKFAIVLLIKFITDLIIFPSLFVFRILRKLVDLLRWDKGKKNTSIIKDQKSTEEHMLINGDSI